MHSNASVLHTVLERCRFYSNEPTVDAKYSNQYLIQHLFYPSMVDVLGRLNLNQDNPITIRFEVSLVVDQQFYTLPPNIQHIWRVATMDDYGHVIKDWYPRGQMNPCGPGWAIDGNTLQILPYPQTAETFQIWYIPTGDVLCHYGTGRLRGNTFTLAATPDLGLLDRRPNAYAGAILRLIPSSGPVQERVIASHDVQQRTVTPRRPFTDDADEYSGGSSQSWASTTSEVSSTSSGTGAGFGETIVYEIAPMGSQPMCEAIALAMALKLGTSRSFSQSKMVMLEREYKKAMKTLTDNLANLQLRTGKAFDKNTVDNPATRYFGG